MLRSLLDDIVRRRLWPIPALALLVAFAAPVLFLKSAPTGAPAADTAAPAPAADGDLPPRAQRLLAGTDAATIRGRASGSARDPFAPPSSRRAAATAAGSGGGDKTPDAPASGKGPGAITTGEPIPVVIQNADGTSSTTAEPRSPSGGGSAQAARDASVDVRFGKGVDSRLHRAIARLETFFVHGKLAAVFVKYSPSRNRAVFAVAPGVIVTGPVECRRVAGLCRYVDIPARSYARLTLLTPDRILVRRRLDVVRIDRSAATGTAAGAASHAGERGCLLRKLEASSPGDPPVDRDACEG